MNFSRAAQGVENAKAFLSPITQVNCLSVQPANKLITWAGRKPGIFKDAYYPLEYQHLVDTQQYSMMLSDGSFFQFYYLFDHDDILQKARLAYYPKPFSTRDSLDALMGAADDAIARADENLYEHLYNCVELLELQNKSPSNTSHIRFDYDATVTIHSPSHIQLGSIQEFRVSAGFYPQPLAFVQLCSRLLPENIGVNIGNLTFEKRYPLTVQRPADSIFLSC